MLEPAHGIADAGTVSFLADYINIEQSEFVRRGIVVGLALQQGRTDLPNEYVERLRAGLATYNAAVSMQIRYSRI